MAPVDGIEILAEGGAALLLLGFFAFLFHAGRTRRSLNRRGWDLLLFGLLLSALGSALTFADGRTGVDFSLAATLSGLAGLALIVLGILRWVPTVGRVTEEIAQREMSEKARNETEERYRSLFEYAHDSIFLIEPETRRILAVNAMASERLGYERHELESMTVDDLNLPDATPRLVSIFDTVIRDGSLIYENTHVRKNGSEMPVEISSRLIDVGGRRVIQAVTRDITERRQAQNALMKARDELERRVAERTAELSAEVAERGRAEEALRASNAELEQFAYAASHDLREPLRMVNTYLQLVEQRYGEKLDDAAHEYIGFAVDGARRMDGLITGLLEYSRVQSTGLEAVPVALDEALEHALVNLRAAIDESDAEIRFDGLPRVVADSGQIIRLFQNLVGNAVKYRRPDVSPEIQVGAKRSNIGWIVSVADNGIGIDPDHAEKVFGVFQRLHPRGEYDGSGVGLAVCRKIVERHGGRIWLESGPDGGTTFFFTLPAAPDGQPSR